MEHFVLLSPVTLAPAAALAPAATLPPTTVTSVAAAPATTADAAPTSAPAKPPRVIDRPKLEPAMTAVLFFCSESFIWVWMEVSSTS